MTPGLRHAALALAVAVLPACPSGPSVGPSVPGGGVGETGGTFSALEASIFVPRCATSACHSGSPPANGLPVSLDQGAGWAQMVGVQAIGAPGLSVVEPGNPDASYLVHKLRNTAGQVGGSPEGLMPPDGQLEEAELQAVEAWIANGALND